MECMISLSLKNDFKISTLIRNFAHVYNVKSRER